MFNIWNSIYISSAWSWYTQISYTTITENATVEQKLCDITFTFIAAHFDLLLVCIPNIILSFGGLHFISDITKPAVWRCCMRNGDLVKCGSFSVLFCPGSHAVIGTPWTIFTSWIFSRKVKGHHSGSNTCTWEFFHHHFLLDIFLISEKVSWSVFL